MTLVTIIPSPIGPVMSADRLAVVTDGFGGTFPDTCSKLFAVGACGLGGWGNRERIFALKDLIDDEDISADTGIDEVATRIQTICRKQWQLWSPDPAKNVGFLLAGFRRKVEIKPTPKVLELWSENNFDAYPKRSGIAWGGLSAHAVQLIVTLGSEFLQRLSVEHAKTLATLLVLESNRYLRETGEGVELGIVTQSGFETVDATAAIAAAEDIVRHVRAVFVRHLSG